MTAAWRSSGSAWQIEAAIREKAQKVGLSPDHVLDHVDVSLSMAPSPLGLHDSTLAAIDQQVRSLALNRPDLVRDPSALKLAPREAYDHLTSLVAAGRRADAEAFQRRHHEAIAIGKAAAIRDDNEARSARDECERRIMSLREQIARKSAVYAEVRKDAEHAEKYGVMPKPAGSPLDPEPATRVSIERLHEHEARLAGEVADLQRAMDEITASPAA
jgi:hypothetical protein